MGFMDLPITPRLPGAALLLQSHTPQHNLWIKAGKMCLLVHFWKVLVSIGWIIHQIFHYCHCPSCNNSRFRTILKYILKSFFLESHFIEIMTPQRDGGSISLLCPVKPKHMHLSITGTSGTVIFVPGSLPSPTKTSSCPSGPCLHSEGCQMHPAISLSSDP